MPEIEAIKADKRIYDRLKGLPSNGAVLHISFERKAC